MDKKKQLKYWSIAIGAVLAFGVIIKTLSQKPKVVEPAPVAAVVPIKPIEPAPMSKPEEVQDPDFKNKPHSCPAPVPVDKALAAVKRGNNRSDKVCYDSESNQYFVHFPNNDDEFFSGWYHIQYDTLNKAANGTYWVDDLDSDHYTRFSPDVTGLPCK
jgi:hypothetical protein